MRHFRKLRLSLVCLLAVALTCSLTLAPALARAVEYSVTDVQTLGSVPSKGYGVNSSGNVAGSSFVTSNDFSPQPFFWSAGTITNIGNFGGDGGEAFAVNDGNFAVGNADTTTGATHPFLWSAASGMKTDLGTLGGDFAVAWDINNANQVVGQSEMSAFVDRAFIWTSAGGMQSLDTLPGGSSSSARGINTAGQIVGDSGTASGQTHAFFYTGGTMSDLGTLGGNLSIAYDLNDSATVVGYSRINSVGINPPYHAFRYTQGSSGLSDLGTLPGGTVSVAYDINNGGTIVGYSEVSPGVRHAFVYDTQNGMRDLNTLTAGSNWTFQEARGISDNGQITGFGLNPDGELHAFLLTPTAAPTAGLQYYPLAHPVRILDTRAGEAACDTPGSPLPAAASRTQLAQRTCDGLLIPSSARAVVGNATVVNNTGAVAGFVTLYPSGTTRPNVSNLNYVPGQTVPNAFTVGLDSSGSFDIYAQTGVNIIVDITGYYAPPNTGGLYYHPLPHPIRLLDTRAGQAACDTPGTPISGNTARTEVSRLTCDGVTIPAAASAIVGNATLVNDASGSNGFVTLYPSGAARPTASNLNYVPGQIVPNAFTVGLGADGAFNIYAFSTLNMIIDVTGYYSNTAAVDANGATGLLYNLLPTPVRLLDTRAGQAACDTPGTPLAGNTARTEVARLTCGGVTIPAAAQAVVGNATVVNDAYTGTGFITLYPSGAARPPVSNLNYVPGQVVPNAFTVGLGADGAFNIYAFTTLDFIVDISGYFAP